MPPPASLEAYLAAIDQRQGNWEHFNTPGGNPESGTFTGTGGRAWEARNARAAQGWLDLASGGSFPPGWTTLSTSSSSRPPPPRKT